MATIINPEINNRYLVVRTDTGEVLESLVTQEYAESRRRVAQEWFRVPTEIRGMLSDEEIDDIRLNLESIGINIDCMSSGIGIGKLARAIDDIGRIRDRVQHIQDALSQAIQRNS